MQFKVGDCFDGGAVAWVNETWVIAATIQDSRQKRVFASAPRQSMDCLTH
jgi:hypothetical protein